MEIQSDAHNSPSQQDSTKSEDLQTKDGSLEDKELDDLLDSALEDFDKPPVKPKEQKNVSNQSTNAGSAVPEWSEEFFQQAQSHFEEAMKGVLQQDPQLLDEFKSFAEGAAKATASSNTGTTDADFASSLSQTLKGLAENAEALNSSVSDDELAKLLSNFGLGDAEGGEGEGAGGDMPDLLPFMANMMQTLLSKDMLYPAIKDIVDKYPDWLADNRSSLPESQYSNYNRQYELMKQVCQEYDGEVESDSDSLKKQRFERILDLMQKMQECGHPPKELIGDLAPGLELDDRGNLKLPGFSSPGDNAQCSLM